ncbi:stage II sporulation protein M [Nitrososphaera sp.]|uniref:stage II sporulation protein M n=1 Tax=Nitrososphaera sp. TaxID=1971748 RepID=UPI00307EDF8A
MRFGIGGRRRLLLVGIGAALFLGMYSAGAAVQMSPEEASQLRKDFSEQIKDIDEAGIFFNNIRIALGMFIPGVGVVLGAASGYVTGNVFSAIAQDTPELQGVPPQVILVTPFGVMEVFAYGLAMSRSGLLVYQFVRKRPWQEYVVPTAIEVGIAAAVLLAGAAVEWWMIQEFGGGLNLEPQPSL